MQNEIKELKKFHVFGENLHGFKKRKLGEYTGEFEMIVRLILGENFRTTKIRFKK